MNEIPKSESAFIVANVIKFGVPLGLTLGLTRLFYFYLFSTQGINNDVIGTSVGIFIFCLIFGMVLGFIRLRRVKRK